MRQPAQIAALAAALLAALIWTVRAPAAPAAAMTVTSAQLAEGGTVPRAQVYARCGGGNVSPALAWSGAPAATRSYAVTVFDPDAGDGGWWHWIVFAIPADRHALARGAGAQGHTPDGAMQGTNDFGGVGYGGPCPPAGASPHRYRITVWALDTATPPFGPDVTGKQIGPWLKAHALASATLTAHYGR